MSDTAGDLLGPGDRHAEAVEVGDEALDVRWRRDDEHRAALHVLDEIVDEATVETRSATATVTVFVVPATMSAVLATCERARQELRRELGVDLQRIQIDEAEVRGCAMTSMTFFSVIRLGIAVVRKVHRRDHLRGMDDRPRRALLPAAGRPMRCRTMRAGACRRTMTSRACSGPSTLAATRSSQTVSNVSAGIALLIHPVGRAQNAGITRAARGLRPNLFP